MPTAAAFRHVAFEDCGTLEDALAARGIELCYVDAPTADLASFDALAPEVLIILGGPIGACDDALYPLLHPELKLIERRLRAQRPTLGICLGAQLMARALGARVYPGQAKEIGWQPLVLTTAGRASVIGALDGATTSMLHWHGDTYDLPAGATLLASTTLTPNQVYTWGPNALAFQCHPEVRGRSLERWLVGHACELGHAGIDVRALRADSARQAPALERAGGAMFAAWLAGVGL
jgi:GMP synthase (glutamine-hydrolysing)